MLNQLILMSKHHQTIPGQVVEAAKTSDDVNITGMFGILVLAGLGWIGSRKRKFCDC